MKVEKFVPINEVNNHSKHLRNELTFPVGTVDPANILINYKAVDFMLRMGGISELVLAGSDKYPDQNMQVVGMNSQGGALRGGASTKTPEETEETGINFGGKNDDFDEFEDDITEAEIWGKWKTVLSKPLVIEQIKDRENAANIWSRVINDRIITASRIAGTKHLRHSLGNPVSAIWGGLWTTSFLFAGVSAVVDPSITNGSIFTLNLAVSLMINGISTLNAKFQGREYRMSITSPVGGVQFDRYLLFLALTNPGRGVVKAKKNA